MSKLENKRIEGLTPNQIKIAIKGNPKKSNKAVTTNSKKISTKPVKAFREPQFGNNGLLLTLPFSVTQTAFQYPTPEWFTSTQTVDVSVIIPIYNTCSEKLIKAWDLATEDLKVELLFIDDNSSLNVKEMIIDQWKLRQQELKSTVGKIYCSSVKQGWGACCNIGAEKATGNIVIFMNPDTVVTPGWLKPIVRLLKSEEIGAVGSLQIDVDERTVIDAGSEWSWEKDKFLEVGKEIYKGKTITRPFKLNNMPLDLMQSKEYEKISSNCMAVRKKDFRFYGGFCPNLVSQEWSDADFCMFLKEKGFKIISQCSSQVFREVKSLMIDRNYESGRMYFNNKWIVSGRIDPLVKSLRQTPIKEVESIVIRRRAAHGDVLIAASVAKALIKKYPKAKIIFSTDCPEVLEGNPWIDQVVEVHSERWFQLYFDLDMIYEYRPDANIMSAYADAVGVDTKDCDLFLETQEIELPEKFVVIHAGKTLWAGRNWTTLKFDSISNKLKAAGYKIVCVGTWSDHKTTSCDLDLRDKTTIPQLAYTIMNSSLFIGIDSFPMHVAQTFEVPGVCFFGSIKPETRLINDSIKPVVATGIKCLGCHHKKPTPCTATSTCDVGIQDCINGVSSETMWQAISEIIQTKEPLDS